MARLRAPPAERGAHLGIGEQAICLGLGCLALDQARYRGRPWSLLLAGAGGWMIARGASGRCGLYRRLRAEPGGLTPLDKRFHVYATTAIEQPPATVQALLADAAALTATCPDLGALLAGRGASAAVAWAGLQRQQQDDGAVRLRAATRSARLEIELRPARDGAASELRLLLCLAPCCGLLGRLLLGPVRGRVQRDLDRLRQRLECGAPVSADGPHGRRGASAMAVLDRIAEELLP